MTKMVFARPDSGEWAVFNPHTGAILFRGTRQACRQFMGWPAETVDQGPPGLKYREGMHTPGWFTEHGNG